MKDKGMENLLQNHPASRKYVEYPKISYLTDLLERLLQVDPS